MTTRILHTKRDIAMLAQFLDGRKLPLTVTIASGKKRSVEQNRLQRLWCIEVSEQLGDRTPEEVRGYIKLTMGVPIMRHEDEQFCAVYDRIIKPLPYEDKLAAMMEPIDLPVTRRMNVSQKVRYLDQVYFHWTGQGLQLTEPDPQFAKEAMKYREVAA